MAEALSVAGAAGAVVYWRPPFALHLPLPIRLPSFVRKALKAGTNVIAVHEYDAVPITAAMPKTLTTAGTSFANCDGVTFTSAPAGLSTGVDYFVRNATTSGSGSSASTSFQVSTSAKGSIVSFTASGSFSGSCIRVIGDVRAERLTGCTIDAPPSPPNVPPGICAAKIDNSTVKVYLWDSANGGVHI